MGEHTPVPTKGLKMVSVVYEDNSYETFHVGQKGVRALRIRRRLNQSASPPKELWTEIEITGEADA